MRRDQVQHNEIFGEQYTPDDWPSRHSAIRSLTVRERKAPQFLEATAEKIACLLTSHGCRPVTASEVQVMVTSLIQTSIELRISHAANTAKQSLINWRKALVWVMERQSPCKSFAKLPPFFLGYFGYRNL